MGGHPGEKVESCSGKPGIWESGLEPALLGWDSSLPDLSFFFCERGPCLLGEQCRGAVTNWGAGPRRPARQMTHLFASSFPLRCKTRIVGIAAL